MFRMLTPNLMVEDVAVALAFYRDALGFTVVLTVPSENEDKDFAILRNGRVELMLQSRRSMTSDIPPLSTMSLGASTVLYVDVGDINSLYERLREQMEVLVPMRATEYEMHEFYARDPFGYTWGFAQKIKR